jgi:hypothetical protein
MIIGQQNVRHAERAAASWQEALGYYPLRNQSKCSSTLSMADELKRQITS